MISKGKKHASQKVRVLGVNHFTAFKRHAVLANDLNCVQPQTAGITTNLCRAQLSRKNGDLQN